MYAEKIANHQIFESFKTARECTSEAIKKAKDREKKDYILRFKKTIQIVSKIISANKDIIPTTVVDSINSYVQRATSHINAYISSQDVNYLINMQPNLDGMIIESAKIPAVENIDILNGECTIIDELSSEKDKFIDDIKASILDFEDRMSVFFEKIEKFDAELLSLKSTYKDEKDEIDKMLEETKDDISKRFTTQLERQKAIVDDIATHYTTKLQTTVNQLENEAGARLEKIKTNMDAEIDILKGNNEAAIKKADNALVLISEQLKKARELVQMTGETSMTGHYQKVAHIENIAADNFRLAALGFMSAAAIFALIMIGAHMFFKNPFDWGEMFLRISGTIILLLPAGYCMNESSRHRTYARQNKKLELELAAIGPYISDLEQQAQQRIKQELTKRLFGQPHMTEKTTKNDISFVKGLIDAIGNLATKLK